MLDTNLAKEYFDKLDKDSQSNFDGSTLTLVLDADENMKNFIHNFVISSREFRESIAKGQTDKHFYLSPRLSLYYKEDTSFAGSFQCLKTGISSAEFLKKLYVYQQLRTMV